MRESTDAFPFLALILDTLTTELEESGLADDLCAKAIYPGDNTPWDYGAESCGGMAYVRLTLSVPTSSFPTPVASVDNCVYTLAHTVEIGVLRPAPMGQTFADGSVDLPSDDDHLNAAAIQMADMEAMYRALKKLPVDLKVVGTYNPQGPNGGVYGGAWTVTVGREL